MSVLSVLRAGSLRAAALSSARSLVLAGGLVVLVPASAQARVPAAVPLATASAAVPTAALDLSYAARRTGSGMVYEGRVPGHGQVTLRASRYALTGQTGWYRNARPSPAEVRIELTRFTAGVPCHWQLEHKGAVLASGVVPAQPGSTAASTPRAPASSARWLGAGVYLLGWVHVVRRIAVDQLQGVRQLLARKVQR